MRSNRLRSIPAVNEIVEAPALVTLSARVPRPLIVDVTREVLDELRRVLTDDQLAGVPVANDDIVKVIVERLAHREANGVRPVINATGVIVHTGLGRAPLAAAAAAAMHDVASCYVALEIDQVTGERGDRTRSVQRLLCELTGAASACVVNNNAAALVLALAGLARDREVIISRGELIEIGGGFRLPEIMAAVGTRLIEVGTTNRTKLSDYERAISASTAAVLKVHPSNFEMSGFVESVSVAELAGLAHSRNLPLIHDIGSGALVDLGTLGLKGEPVARDSIQAGADLVLFSGDKLLGGPQVGIIVGQSQWTERLASHPLMRAMRVDKLTLAALVATLRLHRDRATVVQNVPVLTMITAPVAEVRNRAERLALELRTVANIASATVVDSVAYVGGGSLPRQGIDSAALRVSLTNVPEGVFARLLRMASPGVMARIQKGQLLLDMRTVFPEQDCVLLDVVRKCATEASEVNTSGGESP